MTTAVGRNGSTQAAKPKFPVNFSKSFEDVDVDPTIATIRARYLVRFFSPRLQVLVFAQYSRPKMTRLVAGPRVFFGLRIVAVASPTDVRVLTIICACARVRAPPKASST